MGERSKSVPLIHIEPRSLERCICWPSDSSRAYAGAFLSSWISCDGLKACVETLRGTQRNLNVAL